MAKKICIVEDDQSIQEMYKIKFMAEGYEVSTANNGEEGLATIKEAKPDLVLLDLVMPKMDGFEVLKRLQADESGKKPIVYVLSNLGQSSEIEKGINEGADGYFVKSNMTPTQLAEEVKRIFQGEKR